MEIFFITFAVFIVFAIVLTYCKKRAARTKHGLTGMCHSTGEAMCSSCAGKLQAKPGEVCDKKTEKR